LTAPAAEAAPSRDQLDRSIGPWALGANAVNLTVAAGIFALPAVVAAILGPAAVLAYLICTMLIVLVLGCFAEVGSQVTTSGGAIAYVEEAFGPFAGFLTWATVSVGFSVAADAAIANVMVDSLASMLPVLAGGVSRVLLLCVIFGVLAAVNIRGVRQGTRLSVATTVAKLLPLLLIVVLGAFVIEWRNLAWAGWPSGSQLGAAALVLFFAFCGAEGALMPSGEIRDPARTVPRGMLGAAVAIALLYITLQLTAQGVLGSELTAHSDAPLLAVADRIAGAAGRGVVLVCIVVAIFGALAADMIGAPRGFLAAAESGMLPRSLAALHPEFRTPWVSILVFAGLTLLVSISGAFRPLAVLSSMALLLVYLGVCLAALKLRYTRPRTAGAFRMPGGPLPALLASATVVWLLAHSTLREAMAMASFIAVAMLYYALRRGARGSMRSGKAVASEV
jgi:amino acid transporter